MKNKRTITNILIAISTFLFIFIFGCNPDVTPSLYTDKDPGPTPVITSVTPEQGLAGVTEITITGDNFSEEPEDNFVYFGSLRAEILSASKTELKVVAPDLVQDSIQIKIAVAGVEKFSNVQLYKLDAAVSEVYSFLGFQQPYAVTSDELGNLYFSLVEENTGRGVKKLTPDGEIVDFAPKGAETFFFNLKYKTGGILYGVRGVRALFEITEGNVPAVFAVFDNNTAMFDLDFDKDKNIWTAGKGGKIYRVTSDKDIKSFDFADDVTAMRVYNDYLYLAAKSETTQNIVRIPIISADSLGTPEIYFEISNNYGYSVLDVRALTFSSDGILFIGTDGANPVIFVNPDGTYGYWYENLILPKIINFAWSNDIYLYAVREQYVGGGIETTQTIYSFNMERTGAPEFGRD